MNSSVFLFEHIENIFEPLPNGERVKISNMVWMGIVEGTGAEITLLSYEKYSLENERNMVWMGTVEGFGADQRRDQILVPGSALPLIDAPSGWLSSWI